MVDTLLRTFHCVFALITPYRTSKDGRRKTQLEDISNLIDICRTNPIQVLNMHGFLCRFWLCPSNDILKSNEKIAVGTRTPFQRQEVPVNEQTHVKPNANRGWPIKLVNHIQPQLSRLCPKSSWAYWGFQRHDWPFVRGIHRSPVDSPHKGQWSGALMSSLIPAWTNGGVNHRDAGELKRNRAHYDVTVIIYQHSFR